MFKAKAVALRLTLIYATPVTSLDACVSQAEQKLNSCWEEMMRTTQGYSNSLLQNQACFDSRVSQLI